VKYTLLLSITPNDLISLWDTKEERAVGALSVERFVDLELTPQQVEQLELTPIEPEVL